MALAPARAAAALERRAITAGMSAGYCKCREPQPAPNGLVCQKCEAWLWQPAGAVRVRLVPTDAQIEGDKRQHAPYVLHWFCTCGVEHQRDYSDEHYLSYPTLGAVKADTLWCPTCNAEHPINLKVSLVLEVAP